MFKIAATILLSKDLFQDIHSYFHWDNIINIIIKSRVRTQGYFSIIFFSLRVSYPFSRILRLILLAALLLKLFIALFALVKLIDLPPVAVIAPIKAGCYSKYFPLLSLPLAVLALEMSLMPPYLALLKLSISNVLDLMGMLIGELMGSVCLP
jgi:hypothetical protein